MVCIASFSNLLKRMRKISSTGILHVCIARSFKNRKYFRFKRFMKQGYFRFLWRDQADLLEGGGGGGYMHVKKGN